MLMKNVIWWSLGILLYTLVLKKYPYLGCVKDGILTNIHKNGHGILKNLEIIQNENFSDLIRRLLTIDKRNRISWKEYFSHPFFNKIT